MGSIIPPVVWRAPVQVSNIRCISSTILTSALFCGKGEWMESTSSTYTKHAIFSVSWLNGVFTSNPNPDFRKSVISGVAIASQIAGPAPLPCPTPWSGICRALYPVARSPYAVRTWWFNSWRVLNIAKHVSFATPSRCIHIDATVWMILS